MNRDDLEDAFQQSKSILALEGMTEPASYGDVKQKVLDGVLTFEQAIAVLLEQAKQEARNKP